MRGIPDTGRALAAAFLVAAVPAAHGQSSCSSDGQARPRALLERFISADCAQCWQRSEAPPDTDAAAGVRTAVLDWIVPGREGDDAPLSAAATRDALERLASLHRASPQEADTHRARVGAASGLRVAHGLPFNGYIGTSIAWRDPAGRGRSAWLALVETVPAGTEGTPVPRQLVRNLLRLEWTAEPGRARQTRRYEARPMRIPDGARPDRLRVVGWVEDAQGRVIALAQSACAPPPKGE